ncbi:MAG: response regulator [Alphaproteobacteria bacterium]|nr:response regulator [Alphaproteobacteria bacterium]
MDHKDCSGTVVLVIEDDPMQLTAMRMLMEGWGLSVVAALDGRQAASRVAEGAQPAVIVTDLRLSGGTSGIDAVEELRAALGRDVPAILQTGDTSAESATEIRARGHDLLVKPYDPRRLRALILERASYR